MKLTPTNLSMNLEFYHNGKREDFAAKTLAHLTDGEYELRVLVDGAEPVGFNEISYENSAGSTMLEFLRSLVKAGKIDLQINGLPVKTAAFLDGTFTAKPAIPIDPFNL